MTNLRKKINFQGNSADSELHITSNNKLYRKDNIAYLLMILPAVVLCFLICYMPMSGIILAFKDYDVSKGIFNSDWAGFKNFQFFIESQDFFRITRNTIVLNFIFISAGIIFQVGFALMLNELRTKYFARFTQSIMYIPNFISWPIIGYFLYGFLSMDKGLLNDVLQKLGCKPVMWYNDPAHWPVILLISYIWRTTGSGLIIYLAAMVGINDEYYDAAELDGANKWQQAWYITIPHIIPLIVTLTLLAIGKIMYADFGMFYNLTRDMGALYSTTDVIDTYVYRALRVNGNTGMASAAALYQSFVGFIMILFTNFAVRKYDKDYALF